MSPRQHVGAVHRRDLEGERRCERGRRSAASSGTWRNEDAAFAEAARRAATRGRAFLARVDGPEAFAKHARSLVSPLGGTRGVAELGEALSRSRSEALALMDEWERQTVERVPDLAGLEVTQAR